jgi:hypothetical protein
MSTACRGRDTPDCRVHACGGPRVQLHAQGRPGLATLHPTPVGALWSTQPERARPCMHARMPCVAACSSSPGEEEAHALSRLPRGYKLCALRSRNASSRTGTARNGVCRRWGGFSRWPSLRPAIAPRRHNGSTGWGGRKSGLAFLILRRRPAAPVGASLQAIDPVRELRPSAERVAGGPRRSGRDAGWERAGRAGEGPACLRGAGEGAAGPAGAAGRPGASG